MTTTQLKTARYYGLNLTGLELLLHLRNEGPLPMTALAAELAISSAAVTGAADTLAKKRLVRRKHSHLDRRSIELALTELGHSRVHQITGIPSPLKN